MIDCRECESVTTNPYEMTESFGTGLCPICELKDGMDIDPGVVVMVEAKYSRGWMLQWDWDAKSLEDKKKYIFRLGRLLENK